MADASRNMNLKNMMLVVVFIYTSYQWSAMLTTSYIKKHLIFHFFFFFGISHCISFTMIICRPSWTNNIHCMFPMHIYLQLKWKRQCLVTISIKWRQIYQLIKEKNDYWSFKKYIMKYFWDFSMQMKIINKSLLNLDNEIILLYVLFENFM